MIDNKQTPQEMTALKIMHARQKLYELILQLRLDASNTEDPNARILLDFSAEMMADLVWAFRQYEDSVKSTSAQTSDNALSPESTTDTTTQ